MALTPPSAGVWPRGGEVRRASLLYAALTLVLAWPLSAHPWSRMMWTGPDSELYLWTLLWNTHAVVRYPFSFLDTNICYPMRLALATTENLVGSTLFAAPVIWLTRNPVLALNVVALLSCVLCGLGTYVLARRVGLGHASALLAGVIFAFSPPRFGRIGQLHLTTVQWVPFGLAALHAYLDEGRRRDLWAATALFTLQALTSGHGAVFFLLAAAALIAWRVALGEPVAPGRRLRDFGVAGALLILPALLLVIPYHEVQQMIGLRRILDETWWTDWRRPALSYIASPAHVPRMIASQFVDLAVLDEARSYLFPGLLPLLLGAAALAPRLGQGWQRHVSLARPGAGTPRGLTLRDVPLPSSERSVRSATRGNRWLDAVREWRRSHLRDARTFYALLALGTLWLSAGAPIGPWPWLYSLPGFSFIRVPARFTILSLLALSVLAAFGFERLHQAWRRASARPSLQTQAGRRPGAWMAAAFAAALAAEFAMIPLPTVPYRLEIPAVDRWLARLPGRFVIVEVPFSGERDHTAYMLHSTAHWQPTVNGYTGFRSPLHEELYPVVRRFPSDASLEAMTRLDVRYVVVHGDRYGAEAWPLVEEAIAGRQDRLRLVHAVGRDRVYELRQP